MGLFSRLCGVGSVLFAGMRVGDVTALYYVTEPSCYFRSGMIWVVELELTWVPYLVPYFHLVPMLTFCPLGCGSLLYSISMTFRKSLILLLIFCWPISLRTPLCQVVSALSWAFPTLLSLTPASLTLSFIHIARAYLMSSHVEPFCISFAAWFPIFIGRGLSPECRYPTHVSLHWA